MTFKWDHLFDIHKKRVKFSDMSSSANGCLYGWYNTAPQNNSTLKTWWRAITSTQFVFNLPTVKIRDDKEQWCRTLPLFELSHDSKVAHTQCGGAVIILEQHDFSYINWWLITRNSNASSKTNLPQFLNRGQVTNVFTLELHLCHFSLMLQQGFRAKKLPINKAIMTTWQLNTYTCTNLLRMQLDYVYLLARNSCDYFWVKICFLKHFSLFTITSVCLGGYSKM